MSAICNNCHGMLRVKAGYETCDDCGASQISYLTDNEPSVYHPQRESQVQKDFNQIALPQKIRNDAAMIYLDVIGSDTLKRDRRKAMMCKCAYEAFKSNNIPRDPVMLSKLFGIDVKKLRKAQKDFHEKVHMQDKKSKYPKVHLTAKELLEEFLTLFGVDNVGQNILNLYVLIDELYMSSFFLARQRPRDVAIVVAYWYFEQCGFDMSPEEVHQTFLIPKVTITDLKLRINQLVEADE